MNPSEQSSYLYGQYDEALGEQLKANPSQYVLPDLNKNSSQQKAQVVQKVDSEYLLRDLRNQSKENPNISRDAPNRPFLTGTPVNAKDIRAQIESLDNSIVVPQIIDGKVYFTTHGEADARTAVEGSVSNPNLATANASASGTFQPVDLQKVKFSFAQLVRLLGPSTCQRLEREFVKQNKLSEAELSQLRTARESVSEIGLATSHSSHSTDTMRTAQSVEPNLLSVYSARSPGLFTKKDGILTAQSLEPNLLSVRTANSVEPNLLTVHSARSPGIFTKNDGILTAQTPEPNLLSVRTANSVEPNLLTVYTSRSPGIFTKNDGILTAQSVEPNLLSTRTAHSSASVTGKESTDVNTCYEIQSPTVGVTTALGFATPSGSSQSVFTAQTIRSSEDVSTAMEILSSMSKSSQDVRTAVEIDDDKSSMAI